MPLGAALKVAIRADASVNMGAGHLMRCLCLANSLRGAGAQVTFVCRDLPGQLWALAAEDGHGVKRLPGNDGSDWRTDAEQVREALDGAVDWLIVDHYGLDHRWQTALRGACRHLMVIDDMANRQHDCDLLLDVNLHVDPAERYRRLVPKACKLLLGPGYALLRPSFAEARRRLRPRGGQVRRILVLFGGTDPTNETMKALEAAVALGTSSVDVVVGSAYPYWRQLNARFGSWPGVTLHRQTSQVATLMANADLALGAGGGTTWERCCLGLPSIVSVLADNQQALAESVARVGAIRLIGLAANLRAEDYRDAIRALNAEELRQMSARALALVDGMGSDKVASVLRQHEEERSCHTSS